MASQPEQPVTSDTVQGSDAGTDAPVRTLNQTQGVGYNPDGYAVGTPLQDETGQVSNLRINPETGQLYDATGLDRAAAPTVSPGAGQADDAGATTPLQTGIAVNQGGQNNSANNIIIKPQPNILDQYPSYTYQISVYMLSPGQWDLFSRNQRKTLNQYNLLFQSGGAANNTNGPLGASAGESQAIFNSTDGRNPFFTQDFFIDNVSLTTLCCGKGTGTASVSADLKFTVFEPSNITLLDRIYDAAQDLAPKTNGKINYNAVGYLMVIRFYAYDQEGRLVQVGAADSQNPPTDRRALVEKYIPFRVKDIKFSIAGRLVQYDWECAPIPVLVASSTRRATIPFSVELTGSTVDDMLSGSPVYAAGAPPAAQPGASSNAYDTQDPELRRAQNQTNTTPPPPPKTSGTVIKQGLIQAMNEEQQRRVRQKLGGQLVADVYKIQYSPEAEALIKSARVQKPSAQVNKAATSAGAAVTENTQSASPDKQNMSTTNRNYAITEGMQMLQAIELIIRNSSYITDQANIVFDEVTNLPRPNPAAANNKKGMQWFSVAMSARQLNYDEGRNDYAYEITYTVNVFALAEFDSEFFPPPAFRGLHKSYPYWFTGQNIAVLDYKENFDALYNLVVSGSSPGDSLYNKVRQSNTSSMREIPFIVYMPRSTESSQGALGRANELGANAAESLYHPAALANVKLRIIGDPAWIMQGSMAGVGESRSFTSNGFNPDGSINFDTQDVLFEIAWQKPEDYDLQTGLADPYARTARTTGNRQPIQSRVYKATRCLSEFRGGKFEQTLEGVLMRYALPPNAANRAAGAPQPTVTIGTNSGGATVDPQGNNQTGDQEPRQDTVPADVRAQAATPSAAAITTALTSIVSPQTPLQPSGNFFGSALLQSTAGTGPRPAPVLPIRQAALGSGLFATFPVTANDLASPSPPPVFPTSNGEDISLGAVDQAQSLAAGTAQAVVRDPQIIARET